MTDPTSDRIYKIKDDVRQRDGYCCTQCGMSNEQHQRTYGTNLEVHRVVPGSEYEVDACVTLCRACHGPKPRRPRGEGDYVFIAKIHREMLKRLAKEGQRAISWQLAIAIEEHLQKHGLNPPKWRSRYIYPKDTPPPLEDHP